MSTAPSVKSERLALTSTKSSWPQTAPTSRLFAVSFCLILFVCSSTHFCMFVSLYCFRCHPKSIAASIEDASKVGVWFKLCHPDSNCLGFLGSTQLWAEYHTLFNPALKSIGERKIWQSNESCKSVFQIPKAVYVFRHNELYMMFVYLCVCVDRCTLLDRIMHTRRRASRRHSMAR